MSKIYTDLHIEGQLIYNNNPQEGYVLTTDSFGLVSWTSSTSVSGNYLPLTGGTMSGDIHMNGAKIIGTDSNNYIQLASGYQYFYYEYDLRKSSIINNSGVELKGGFSDDSLYGDLVLNDTNSIFRYTKNGDSTSFTLSDDYSSGGGTASAYFEDSINNVGIVYKNDYSSNFVDNSLVTKKYVDSSYSVGLGLTSSNKVFRVATASSEGIGGIIVGSGLTVSNTGVLSVSGGVTSLQSGVFKANISQQYPEYRINNDLPLGTIWTIATYSIGDDFSNMELIRASTFSGTINGKGAVLRAINGYNDYNTQPTVWSNGSILNYDGRPYYTSINSNGNYGPFYNSFNQDFNFSYVGLGIYAITSTGSFVSGKHSFSITNHSGGFDMIRSIRVDDNKYHIIANDIATKVISVNGSTFSNGSPETPISYTASFGIANKDYVLVDAYIIIERWV